LILPSHKYQYSKNIKMSDNTVSWSDGDTNHSAEKRYTYNIGDVIVLFHKSSDGVRASEHKIFEITKAFYYAERTYTKFRKDAGAWIKL